MTGPLEGPTATPGRVEVRADYKGRVPRKGDRVGTAQKEGIFTVVSVDKEQRSVTLKLDAASIPELHNIPWSMLVYERPKAK